MMHCVSSAPTHAALMSRLGYAGTSANHVTSPHQKHRSRRSRPVGPTTYVACKIYHRGERSRAPHAPFSLSCQVASRPKRLGYRGPDSPDRHVFLGKRRQHERDVINAYLVTGGGLTHCLTVRRMVHFDGCAPCATSCGWRRASAPIGRSALPPRSGCGSDGSHRHQRAL
jgi:hypothetical protein